MIDQFGFPVIEFRIVRIVDKKQQMIFIPLKAILDTGSQHCYIHGSLIESLGVKPSGKKHKVNKPMEAGIHEVDSYNITIYIPYLDKSFQFAAHALIGDYPYPLILGTDFLKNCELNYNGEQRNFELKLV